MNEHSEIAMRRALRTWQTRQQMDGYLAAALVLISLFLLLRFLVSPGSNSAWVMGFFLVALGVTCVHLLMCAAMVVRIRSLLYPRFAPEIIEAEVVDSINRQG